jgi:hypothetical protein
LALFTLSLSLPRCYDSWSTLFCFACVVSFGSVYSLSLFASLLRFLVYSLLLCMRRSVTLLFPCLIAAKTLGSEQQLLLHLVLSCSFLCMHCKLGSDQVGDA